MASKVLIFPDPESGNITLLPPGQYQLKLLEFRTASQFKSARLILEFSIVDFGEHFEKRVCRYYNIERIIGKPAINGRFKAKPHGDFLIEYYTLFGGPRISRLDRVPMGVFRNSILVGQIRTVTKNNQQKVLPVQMHYSVVAALTGLSK